MLIVRDLEAALAGFSFITFGIFEQVCSEQVCFRKGKPAAGFGGKVLREEIDMRRAHIEPQPNHADGLSRDKEARSGRVDTRPVS